jgi:hypothetical protein
MEYVIIAHIVIAVIVAVFKIDTGKDEVTPFGDIGSV